ncbi:Uncharacterized protein PAKB6_4366 [Pseudomonas aeruginosa]|nr:Uncharacterized protein PAKB6_4366 [Pseudomonas aeruginosa]
MFGINVLVAHEAPDWLKHESLDGAPGAGFNPCPFKDVAEGFHAARGTRVPLAARCWAASGKSSRVRKN